jgi:3-phosphoshikimate 1-carboxyvinyltransferase
LQNGLASYRPDENKYEMIARINPLSQRLNSSPILSPRSKSSMQRACAAALLRKGITEIIFPGHSQDDLAAMDVIQKLGATVLPDEARQLVEVRSEGVEPFHNLVDCGESGLGIRMFTPIAALSNKELTVTGRGSLVTRPMHFFDEIFPQLGIRIQSEAGRLPLRVHGPLKPADIEVDGSLSSQFLTGLLMAFSAAGASDVEIRVLDLKSKPYISLTLDVMQSFGMHLPENRNFESFYFPTFRPLPQRSSLKYAVEGDWSGSSFLIVAAAIGGDMTIQGLQKDSSQADKAILFALEAAGVEYIWDGDDLHVYQSAIRNPQSALRNPESSIRPFHFDATECPDLFPPMVSLAAFADGLSVIKGAGRLTHKESDRAKTLREEFGKLGLRIELAGDEMRVHGGQELMGGEVHSRHDHRIAMALAIAGLRAAGPVIIDEAQAIGKSYPDFYADLQRMGVEVEISPQHPLTSFG